MRFPLYHKYTYLTCRFINWDCNCDFIYFLLVSLDFSFNVERQVFQFLALAKSSTTIPLEAYGKMYSAQSEGVR